MKGSSLQIGIKLTTTSPHVRCHGDIVDIVFTIGNLRFMAAGVKNIEVFSILLSLGETQDRSLPGLARPGWHLLLSSTT
jgi:hypothetical protein